MADSLIMQIHDNIRDLLRNLKNLLASKVRSNECPSGQLRPEVIEFTILHDNIGGSFFLIEVVVVVCYNVFMIQALDHSEEVFHF